MPQPEDRSQGEPADDNRKTSPRILITGANGMIGHALRAAAVTRGWEAVPAMRPGRGNPLRQEPASPDALLWEPEAAQPFADLELLEGFDVVVHLSGANISGKRWTPAYKKTIIESRTLTTGALSLALARLRKPPAVLITASATGFYGSRGDEELTEESGPGSNFLSEVCQLWEGAASPAVAAGMRVVHARFGVVLTPFGGALQQMLPLFRMGLGGKLGSGRQWMSWIGLEDLLGTLFHCVEHTELHGAVNLVSPQPVRNSEFAQALARVLRRPAALPAPAFALRAAFGEMANETLLASCRALPECLSASGFSFRLPEIGAALRHMLGRPSAA